ncbi:MAG: sigma-54-dependent Fis family transcriptional regulator [Syntrophorhabdaceae bacterium]|nr:sigma-54-dependent Fis family transcriptional regulator [Syntrophorhabdaceae bacterium]
MKDRSRKLLVIDDEVRWCQLLNDTLTSEGFDVTVVSNSTTASQLINQVDFDVILTDLRMAGKDGLQLLEETKRVAPTTPVILITAFGSIDSAVQAMKMGAYDFITKSGDMSELVLAVEKALETKSLRKEVIGLRRKLESQYSFHKMIGKSPLMQRIYQLIEMVCDTSSNVLVTGESGTGKELVAKAIHYNGVRKNGPFIAVNCAAIPENLLESELFGYRKGAFTDAKTDKEGLVVGASGGTLFLDEVTEMPPSLQAKILRVIEEREVRPLGGTTSYPTDVRVISTSNRDIQTRIDEGLFRSDLYYRLRVIDIDLPPLRERKEDIPLLVMHFLNTFNKDLKKKVPHVSTEAMKIFMDYSWPGNVRELENVIQRAVTLCRGETVIPDDLPVLMTRAMGNSFLERAVGKGHTLLDLEKEYVREVLAEVRGNRSRAAEILGIDRKTLYRKLKSE